MEQADLHPFQTSLLDAPPLQLRVTLGCNGLSVHGQDAFIIFARPVVSDDKTSIRYDGFTTVSQGDTLRTYMIVDGAGYMMTTSEDPAISRTVECLSSVSPFDLILSALNNASVVSSTVLSGESIQCPSGPLLQTSFGGVDFALCTAGKSGVNVLGTSGSSAQVIDMIVAIDCQQAYIEWAFVAKWATVPLPNFTNWPGGYKCCEAPPKHCENAFCTGGSTMGERSTTRTDISLYDAIQQTPKPKSKQRSTPFQSAHELEFGLQVSEREPSNGNNVLSVLCRFCAVFGREEKVGAKRKKTTNIKYFRRPFHPEHYRKHHYNQHPNKWKQYQLLTEAECKTFFDDRSLHRSSMHLYLNENQAPQVIEVDRAIVEGIIDSFLVGDDVDDISWDRILSRLCCNVANTHYVLNIVNPVQFHLIVDYLSIGMSFRMALATLTKTRHRTGLVSLGSCTPELPAKYARFACMINLQKLKSLMAAEWTFAIALDMSTHLSVSYLDIRVRLYFNGRLLNFHLLAIPINERHTAEVMFGAAAAVLDVMCPHWRDVIIGITTGGERKMTGRISGLATRFQRVCREGFVRVWCGLHQLDLILQSAIKTLRNGHFYRVFTRMITQFRRQQNLISKMQTTAPLLSDTRWESMRKCCKWFKKYRSELEAHLRDNDSGCRPPEGWWLVLTIAESVSSSAIISFRTLEGKTALVAEQSAQFQSLFDKYKEKFNAKVGLDDTTRTEVKLINCAAPVWPPLPCICSRYAISPSGTIAVDANSLLELLRDDGNFTIAAMGVISPDELYNLLFEVARVLAEIMEGLNQLQPKRDSNNMPLETDPPPVLPHHLVSLRGRDLSTIIDQHRARMTRLWKESDLDQIEQEHSAMRQMYASSTEFRAKVEQNVKLDFANCWDSLDAQYPALKRFAGGLSTIFPGTSTVESDFSLLKWVKPSYKSRLTDFSLEGALHTKQFEELDSIPLD